MRYRGFNYQKMARVLRPELARDEQTTARSLINSLPIQLILIDPGLFDQQDDGDGQGEQDG